MNLVTGEQNGPIRGMTLLVSMWETACVLHSRGPIAAESPITVEVTQAQLCRVMALKRGQGETSGCQEVWALDSTRSTWRSMKLGH